MAGVEFVSNGRLQSKGGRDDPSIHPFPHTLTPLFFLHSWLPLLLQFPSPSCRLLQQANLSKQTGWHLIFPPTLLSCKLNLHSFLLLPSLPPPHCSQVSFLWQATGYQLLGASPAASPPSPSLPSFPHSLSPAAQGPSSRWEIRHHDTNKLSPYFKKAQRGSAPLRVCKCVTHVHFSVSQ